MTDLNTHSFRIGGASAAAAGGLTDSEIRTLGRWSSDAFRVYVRYKDNIFIRFSDILATPFDFVDSWNPYSG